MNNQIVWSNDTRYILQCRNGFYVKNLRDNGVVRIWPFITLDAAIRFVEIMDEA